MTFLLNLLLVVQVLSALAMIGLILVQHGKGADMGAAFGSGASGSLFGASGSANFLSRTTAVLATIFFVATLVLAYFGNLRNTGGSGSVLSGMVAPAAVTAPASAPASAAAPATGPAALIPVQQPAAAVAPESAAVPASQPAPVAPVAAASR